MDTDNSGKVFIFHKEKYICDSLAKALGYTQSYYLPFCSPDAIIAHLKENQASLLLINGDSPEYLKTILNEVFGGIKANRTPLLIFSLSNQGSLINANKSSFKELQECFDNKLVDIIQLPFIQISDITCNIEKLKSAYQNNHKISEDIRKKVAERIAEQQDVSQRHINKNLQAAERILNGALRSGDYNLLDSAVEKKAIEYYEQLISAQPKDKEKEIKEARETIDMAKNALASSPAKEEWHKHIKKILIIDDQKEMWEPVWKFILGDNKVDIVEDSEAGLDKIRKGIQYDCVLLDIDLGKDENGKDKENGIVILQRIKHEQFDLPVIMMTAYDDMEITSECFGHGATYFFVKEREDPERDSIQYFTKIKEMLLSIRTYDCLERKLYRDFVEIEKYFHGNYTEPGNSMRKAIFFFMLDSDEKRAKKYLSDNPLQSQYIDSIYNAFLCVEEIIDLELVKKNEPDLRTEPIFSKYRKFNKNFRLRTALCTLFEVGYSLGHLDINKLIKLKKSNQLDRSKTFAHIGNAINWCKEYFTEIEWKPKIIPNKNNCADNVPRTQRLSSYRETQEQERLGHPERSRAGVIRLLIGAFLHKFQDIDLISERKCLRKESISELILLYEPENYILFDNHKTEHKKYRCVFIDDDGELSGWDTVLRLLLPDVEINYIEYNFNTTNEIISEIRYSDFVILDLRLPDKDGVLHETNGIKLLENIKNEYSELPVIILTASDDALWYRKSISRGAFACFPKTNQDFYRIDEKEYFSKYYDRFKMVFEKIRKDLSAEYLSIYRDIDYYKKVDIFFILKYLPASMKTKENKLSREVICNELMKAFFFMNPDRNITVNTLLERLFVSAKFTINDQSISSAIRASEYVFKVFVVFKSNDFQVYGMTGGEILYKYNKGKSNIFRQFSLLWSKRNVAKNMGSESDYTSAFLILKETNNFIVDTMKEINCLIDNWVLQISTPHQLDKYWWEILFFQSKLGDNDFIDKFKNLLGIYDKDKQLFRKCLRDIFSLLINRYIYKKYADEIGQRVPNTSIINTELNELYLKINTIIKLNDTLRTANIENKTKINNIENEINKLKNEIAELNNKWRNQSNSADTKSLKTLNDVYSPRINDLDGKIADKKSEKLSLKKSIDDTKKKLDTLVCAIVPDYGENKSYTLEILKKKGALEESQSQSNKIEINEVNTCEKIKKLQSLLYLVPLRTHCELVSELNIDEGIKSSISNLSSWISSHAKELTLYKVLNKLDEIISLFTDKRNVCVEGKLIRDKVKDSWFFKIQNYNIPINKDKVPFADDKDEHNVTTEIKLEQEGINWSIQGN